MKAETRIETATLVFVSVRVFWFYALERDWSSFWPPGSTRIGGQSRLSRLILQVASQIGSPQSATQVLFLVTEEVLRHVVGSLDDCHNASLLIAADRVSEQAVPVTIKIFDNDGTG